MGQDLYPPEGPSWPPRADTTLEGRAGPWGWRQAEARLGYLPAGGGGGGSLVQAWLTTAQVSTEALHLAQAPRLLAGQGGSPTSHSPFPTQLISHRSGSTAAPGAGPTPGEQTGAPLGWDGVSLRQRQPAGPGAAQLAAGRLGSWKSRCVSLKFVAILWKSACFRGAGTEIKN